MKILIVGQADSIFLVNYVSALKAVLSNVTIHIYSPFHNSGVYKILPYDKVTFDDYDLTTFNNIPKVSFLYKPYIQYRHFITYLEKNKSENYDIVHFHWLIPAWTIGGSVYKKYCKKMYLSFWGGEIENGKILLSHNLYLSKLKSFLDAADKIIGANDDRIKEIFPYTSKKCCYGAFGSSIIDILCHHSLNKSDARDLYKVPGEKISVMLGYSGKSLHNHIKILNAIINHPNFADYKDKIHFIASMTRGASKEYADNVEEALKSQPSTYTIIRDCYQNDEEVAKLRLATDILFQLSDFDYLSASVKENLCAGVVMISGAWLPYQVLKNENFYFNEVATFEDGIECFYYLLSNFESSRKLSIQNETLCNAKYSWEACIKDWVVLYK